ncbi:MAG: hypothetical protein ACOC44_08245 [Promethearchaeia archaeon]
MEIIKVLGKELAEHIEISPAAARGLIKLALKDEFDPFKPFEEFSYTELKKAIQHSLNSRLKKLQIKNRKKIIKLMKKELKENQSLITMEQT